jgi:hypothetical protein
MNEAQSSGASGANGGLKAGAMSPDELDKLAALFVATWDQPADASALGATTAMGVAPPPHDIMTGAAQPAQKNDPKRTMMGIAAPLASQPEAPIALPQRAAVDPMAPTGMIEAVPAQPIVAKPRPMPTPSIADSSGESAAVMRKRSPLPFVIGGGVLVAAVAIFFATRSPDKPPSEGDKSAPTVESKTEKTLDLPDPNSVSTSAAATNTATATATAATTATTTAPADTAAKTADTTPEPPTKDTATAAPKAPTPPPVATPKMTATAAPKPPPVAATTTAAKPPPTKKPPQKIKDEF